MRTIRTPVLACLLFLALAGAVQLTGCTNPGQNSEQGMIAGRGPDYTH